MTDIRLDHIAKRYDNGFEAVKDLSLVFEAGSFTVLLGPSGCGKTTTLRMIAGLETISSGHLYFGEKEVTDVPPKDRDIGMVFQNYALYPHLTVFENIAFPLRLRKTPKKEVEERVRAAATTVELEHLLERKPKQLSGGQRQRVALARAIVRKPRVFLFDEPLSNLDAQLRQQMRAEITRLQRMVGATAVYVTHDQSEAMTMADRIVILNQGELQQVGTPQEIYANPANRFVAGFVGSPAINFFEGTLQRIDGHDSFCENGSSLVLSLEAPNIPKTLHHGHKYTLAIRPEHLLLTQPMSNSPLYFFSATVERIEFLGHERLLYIQTAPQLPPQILRTNDMSSEIPMGVTMTFYAAPEHCYFFDEAGKRL